MSFYTVSVYVPSLDRHGQPLPHGRDRTLAWVRNRFLDWYGGGNVADVRGFYRMDNGGVADELTTIVSSDTDTTPKLGRLRLLAKQVARELDQEAAYFTVVEHNGWNEHREFVHAVPQAAQTQALF